MGIIQHKPIEELIQQKFRLAREKDAGDQYQLCVWKYTIEDLTKQLFKFKDSVNYPPNSEYQQICKGECLEYPFKMFTDEGYICAILQNNQNQSHSKNHKLFGPITAQTQKEKCVPLQVLELLYLFSLNSFHSYYSNSLEFQTYSVHFQIICGDLLQPVQKLKLLSILNQLQKYVRLGSQNIVKKMFNEPKSLKRVNVCYKNQLQNITEAKDRERMVQISKLITKKLVNSNLQKQFSDLTARLCEFKVLQVFIFGIGSKQPFQVYKDEKTINIYKKIRKSTRQHLKNFQEQAHKQQNEHVLLSEVYPPQVQRKQINHNINHDKKNNHGTSKPVHHNQILGDQFQQYSDIIKNNQKQEVDLDVSSPFLCEITQIQQNDKFPQKNKNQANKPGQRHIQMGGDMDQSLFLPKQLQNLKIDRNLYPLKLQKSYDQLSNTHPQLILSTYPGSSVYSNLTKNNICLIVNLTPQQGYNYFVNDINYQWYFLRTFKHDEINQTSIDKIKNIQEFNIQALFFRFVSTIQQSLASGSQKVSNDKKKVAVFCNTNNFLYSGAFAMAYLIVKNHFRFTFQQALEVVMNSTQNKFYLTKVYELQLRDLHSRIQTMSSISNINSLNTKSSLFKLYSITPYNVLTPYHLVCKYMGQISNSNQLQGINNSNKAVLILIPTNISSILIKIVNLMRQDPQNAKPQNVKKNMKNMGLSIKLMCGKETQQRAAHLAFALKQLPIIVKYQFINFSKKVFNVEKYKNKIQTILQCLQGAVSVQNIQKSFRKPQPFTPLIFAQLNAGLLVLKPSDFKQKLPYNSKQTLTFKYPILRPIFQSKRKQGYYILLKRTANGQGCNVKMHKGKQWIGLEEDKQSFFQRIIQSYIKDIGQDKIWIEDNDQAQASLFDDNSIGF